MSLMNPRKLFRRRTHLVEKSTTENGRNVSIFMIYAELEQRTGSCHRVTGHCYSSHQPRGWVVVVGSIQEVSGKN